MPWTTHQGSQRDLVDRICSVPDGIFEFRFSHDEFDSPDAGNLALEHSDIEGFGEGWAISEDGCALPIAYDAMIYDAVVDECDGPGGHLTMAFTRLHERTGSQPYGHAQFIPATRISGEGASS